MLAPVFLRGHEKNLLALLFAGLILSGCGGGSSSNSSQSGGPLAGNWQFTLAAPSDRSFLGTPSPSCPPPQGTLTPLCSGGFLQQNKSSVTGGVVYSVALPGTNGGSPTVCNSGSAPVTGTINGQDVTLTAVAGTQTFTLKGTLSANGSTMMGTYASTDGKGCGTAQTGLQWQAASVQPMTGAVQGSFHSEAGGPLYHQDFPVSGTLTQGPNIGASNATITGTLSFQGYPCLDTASVNGQVSGNSVILQIIASNGLNVGQIGAPVGSSGSVAPVVFESSAAGGGYLLHGAKGYGLTTKNCSSPSLPPDIGNVCLGLGNATGCTEPISLSPASITFPAQAVGSFPTTQTITLTNTDPSGSPPLDLNLSFTPLAGATDPFSGSSDFNGLPNFTEQDTCANPFGSSFSLGPQQSCSITVAFSPQESCPWLPLASGNPPSQIGAAPSLCPFPLTAGVTVNSSASADGDKHFAVPITGIGLSALVPSTPELDFGAEALSESSLPQLLSFTNQGTTAVQILPRANQPCQNPAIGPLTLSRPLVPGEVDGVRVVQGAITPNGATINYFCDVDSKSNNPNFQISQDTCTGTLLVPLASCNLEVAFVPQPGTLLNPALDYFLELDTLQCTSNTTSNCEIDSGRFPVELKANTPSPLRMSPGAGLDFGKQAVGQASTPLMITLFNDPNDPKSATVNFTGNQVIGDYAETDDCGASLAPGSSCTLTVTFKPKIVGFDSGTITITYTVGQTQIVYLRGIGQ
jgi:hypothetical protein